MRNRKLHDLPDYSNCLVNLSGSILKKFGAETAAETLPLADRALSSLYVRENGRAMLIDCGEGTQVGIRKLGWGESARSGRRRRSCSRGRARSRGGTKGKCGAVFVSFVGLRRVGESGEIEVANRGEASESEDLRLDGIEQDTVLELAGVAGDAALTDQDASAEE